MTDLNYHHLIYFYEIARAGSVVAAAEFLCLSQSTLSAQLKSLEHALDVQLFDRVGKRLRLTEEGKLAFKYAEEIQALGHEFLSTLAGNASTPTPHLSIGVVESVPKAFPRRLAEFLLRTEDGVRLRFVEGTHAGLLSQLLAFQLDVAILGELPSSTDLSQLEHVRYDRFAVSFYGAPIFAQNSGSLQKRLSELPFVLPSRGSRLRHAIDQYFGEQGVHPLVLLEAEDAELQLALCCDGHGLTVLPQFAARAAVANGSLVDLGKLDRVYDSIWMVSHSSKFQKDLVRTLMKRFRIRRAD